MITERSTMPVVLAPNTLSQPQIVTMVLKNKTGRRCNSGGRLISSLHSLS